MKGAITVTKHLKRERMLPDEQRREDERRERARETTPRPVPRLPQEHGEGRFNGPPSPFDEGRSRDAPANKRPSMAYADAVVLRAAGKLRRSVLTELGWVTA